MRPHPKRVQTNPGSPSAWATDDRTGFVVQKRDLCWQWEWAGKRLVNQNILVHPDFLDEPQRQLGTIILPPDPEAVMNARIENYTIDEQESILEDQATLQYVSSTQTFGNILQDQDGNDLFSGGSPTFSFTAPTIGADPYAPTLAWDFTDGSGLPSWITASGGANGTYFTGTGILATGVAPRFDYDPVTLAARGLLIEEAITNLATQSNAFNIGSPSWNVPGVSVTAASGISPDGTNNAWLLTPNAGASSKALYQDFTATAVPYTNSAYVKASGGSWFGLGFGLGTTVDGAFFNVSTGAIGTVAAGTTATITNAGNGWYRVAVTRTLTAATKDWQGEPHSADNQANNWNSAAGAETLLIYGAQTELGAFATSYIPTTTVVVTRTADVFSLTSFPSYLATAASIIAEVSVYVNTDVTQSQNIIGIDDGGVGNFVEIMQNGSFWYFRGRLSFVLNPQLNSAASAAGTITRIGGAYANLSWAYVNGGANLSTDSVTQLASGFNRCSIGSRNAGQYLDGWLRKIAIYNSRIPNSILQQKSNVGNPF